MPVDEAILTFSLAVDGEERWLGRYAAPEGFREDADAEWGESLSYDEYVAARDRSESRRSLPHIYDLAETYIRRDSVSALQSGMERPDALAESNIGREQGMGGMPIEKMRQRIADAAVEYGISRLLDLDAFSDALDVRVNRPLPVPRDRPGLPVPDDTDRYRLPDRHYD